MLAQVVIIGFCISYIKPSTELPSWHLQPLGSHVKPDAVDESFLDNIISPKDFAEKYVIPRKPIVFRNVVKEWPAFKLWNDGYLAENYGEMELRLEGKKEKQSGIPKGDVCLGRDRLKTFLKDYKHGANKYVVSDLPTPMWHEVYVPPPMSCGEFLENYVEIDLWINSDLGKKGQGGNSILHKDAFNTVNCVLNGSKEWKLIELKYNDYVYQSWEGPMDAGYGGFSLVNPEMVDATKFPDIGKITKWQFTTVNAGDCLYLPSQMWHQVKSFGETNRAVAFLFSQFANANEINTTNCPRHLQNVLLSDVDVDLQYPGHGVMTMGNFEIKSLHEMMYEAIDSKKGFITKKRVYRFVYENHRNGAINKDLILKKAKALFHYLLETANGDAESMNKDFVRDLTRDQLRQTYQWIFPMEPANNYEHEYAYFTPEEIIELITDLTHDGAKSLFKEELVKEYQEKGGTAKFAEELWERLAGKEDSVTVTEKNLAHATEKYEYFRRDKPDEDYDDEDTITTPQGHKSQPRKFTGGYGDDDKGEKVQGKEKRDEL